jgi:hypothetical protein
VFLDVLGVKIIVKPAAGNLFCETLCLEIVVHVMDIDITVSYLYSPTECTCKIQFYSYMHFIGE